MINSLFNFQLRKSWIVRCEGVQDVDFYFFSKVCPIYMHEKSVDKILCNVMFHEDIYCYLLIAHIIIGMMQNLICQMTVANLF